jgi:hypothetical protein
MTPYEILTGSKPNIRYFWVFGCKCFFQRKGVRLGKFDPKAVEGIFVGYGAESHTYGVFNKSTDVLKNLVVWNSKKMIAPKGGEMLLLVM